MNVSYDINSGETDTVDFWKFWLRYWNSKRDSALPFVSIRFDFWITKLIDSLASTFSMYLSIQSCQSFVVFSFHFYILYFVHKLASHSPPLNPKLPAVQPFPVHLGRLTCGRFIQKRTQVKHFKHGIHRFMWIFDSFTRAANFLENSHFLFAALLSDPITC